MKITNGNTELTNAAEFQDKAAKKTQIDKAEARALIRKHGLVKGLKMVKHTIANRNLNKE